LPTASDFIRIIIRTDNFDEHQGFSKNAVILSYFSERPNTRTQRVTPLVTHGKLHKSKPYLYVSIYL